MCVVCDKTKLAGVLLKKKPKVPSKSISAKEEQLGPCLREALFWASCAADVQAQVL